MGRLGSYRPTIDVGGASAQRRWSIALGVALFALLSAIYWLTFDGAPISNDEQYLFDSTQSLVRRGSLRPTILFDLQPSVGADGVPWLTIVAEPLQAALAAPLFWLAQNSPAIGLMHTVWLLNIIVTALTATGLYAAGLFLGYRPCLAWLGALLFGLATSAWPYSRTFFREPLAGLFVMGAFVGALAIRRDWPRLPKLAVALTAVSLCGGMLTKVTTLLFLPGLFLVAVPVTR